MLAGWKGGGRSVSWSKSRVVYPPVEDVTRFGVAHTRDEAAFQARPDKLAPWLVVWANNLLLPSVYVEATVGSGAPAGKRLNRDRGLTSENTILPIFGRPACPSIYFIQSGTLLRVCWEPR